MPHSNIEERRKYHREYNKNRYKNDPLFRERVKFLRVGKQRDSSLRCRHGITEQEYDRILTLQNGKCAICGRSGIRLCVDHNHISGNVRGLLCTICNTHLGWFEAVGQNSINSYLGSNLKVNYHGLKLAKRVGQRIKDGLNKSQRHRLKDLSAYRKRKREYAKTPEQRIKRLQATKRWYQKRKILREVAISHAAGISINHGLWDVGL